MPPAACVFCREVGKQAKLISCLHSACVPCVVDHLLYDGSIRCPSCRTVTPPPPRGVPQVLSLPNSCCPGPGEQDGEVGSKVLLCDECGVDEAATSQCAECCRLLCEVHTKSHPRSRGSLNHTVNPLAGKDGRGVDKERRIATGGVDGSPPPVCALHHTQPLTQFCMPCNQLLCARCLDTGPHAEHAVLAIQEAAKKTRGSVRAKLESCASGSDSRISGAIEDVQKSIQELHGQAESASERVAAFFVTLTESLKQREKLLLDQLDHLRSEKLQPLEKQQVRLQDASGRCKMVADTMAGCSDDVNFLKLWTWLGTAIDATAEVAERDAQPCRSSRISFCSTDVSALSALVAAAGTVLDAADSTVRWTGDPRINSDISLIVELTNGDRPEVCQPLTELNLEVAVLDPAGDTNVCVDPQRAASGELEFTYRPERIGRYTVSAKVSDVHLKGSPAEFIGYDIAQWKFNPERSHTDLKFCDDNRTVRNTFSSWRSVCTGDIPPQQGVARLKVRIDDTKSCWIFLCACCAAEPRLDTYHSQKSEIFGWQGYNNSSYCNGGVLGQRWEAGDVVHLELDMDKHTLTGRHERTGATEVLQVVAGTYYWYVSLHEVDQQVTILQC